MFGNLASIFGQTALDIGGHMLKSGMSSAGGFLNSFANGFINEFFGERSQDSALAAAQGLSAWNKALDYEYTRKRDDDLFDLTRRYLGNTAKWQVDGLKAAGLNPILAFSNLGASTGLGAGSAPSPSLGSVSPYKNNVNLSESMRTLSAIDLNESTAKQIQSQTALNRSTVNYQDVQSAKIASEIESQQIQNKARVIEELAKLQKGHDTGLWGSLSRGSEMWGDKDSWVFFNDEKKKIARQLVDIVSGVPTSDKYNSAKSASRVNEDSTPRLEARSENTSKSVVATQSRHESSSDKWRRRIRHYGRILIDGIKNAPLVH